VKTRALGLGLCLALPAALALGTPGRVGVAAAATTARAAAGASAGARDPAVIEQLTELLAAGTTPGRTLAALGAIAQLGDPRCLEAVALYAGHRRPEVRLEAVKALAAINDPRTVPVLLLRLGDEAPEVRAAAGQALAARGESRAVPRLTGLVKRNDPAAAAPLGRLATPETIAELRERQGAIADPVLATVLGAYIKRADVGDGARIDLLRALGDLSSAEATAALRGYLASIPPRDNRASKREAQRLIDAREGDK
jgi:HEAT repeat protein